VGCIGLLPDAFTVIPSCATMQLWVKTPASLSEKGGLVGIALINEWATKVYGLVDSYMTYLLFVIQVSFLSVLLWAHAQLWLMQLDLSLFV